MSRTMSFVDNDVAMGSNEGCMDELSRLTMAVHFYQEELAHAQKQLVESKILYNELKEVNASLRHKLRLLEEK